MFFRARTRTSLVSTRIGTNCIKQDHITDSAYRVHLHLNKKREWSVYQNSTVQDKSSFFTSKENGADVIQLYNNTLTLKAELF